MAMKAKHKRLFFVSFGLALLGGAVALALVALQDTVTFFFTPSQAAERGIPAGQRVRLGGLVEEKSIKKLADGVTVEFRVTDNAKTVTVRYKGVLHVKGFDRKVVFQGVHQLMGSDVGPKWAAGEKKTSKMVFIGIDLPKDIFNLGLEQCLA